MSPPHWLSTSPSACPDSTVKHRHVQDQSLRLAPAAQRDARRRCTSTAPSRSPSPSDAFDTNFYMWLQCRVRSLHCSSTPHRPSSHANFLRTRALPSTACFPHDFFPLPPPRLHCRAARRCAACAGRTGPPLAAACSRALRLLGSSARPRLRLRVWASAEPFLRGSGFAVTDCRRPPFGAANSLPPLAPARNAHTTREGGLGGEREASPPR